MNGNQLIGWRKVSYTNKSGRLVEGYTVYYTYKSTNVIGYRSGNEWLNLELGDRLIPEYLGKSIEFTYNRFGSVTDFTIKEV